MVKVLIYITHLSLEKMNSFINSSELTVFVRGGKPLVIPVRANSIIPDVKIEED